MTERDPNRPDFVTQFNIAANELMSKRINPSQATARMLSLFEREGLPDDVIYERMRMWHSMLGELNIELTQRQKVDADHVLINFTRIMEERGIEVLDEAEIDERRLLKIHEYRYGG